MIEPTASGHNPTTEHFATICGRYEGLPIHFDASVNYEAEMSIGEERVWVNAFDLMEVALALAWALDCDETTRLLTLSRLHGFEVPPQCLKAL